MVPVWVVVVLIVVVVLLVVRRNRRQNSGLNSSRRGPSFQAIGDNYRSLDEVQAALRRAGLESSNLIIGIDFTKSNEYTGTVSFGGRCMHEVTPGRPNPYQRVIEIVGRTLEVFDDDRLIPTFGFGDATTGDRRVFPFFPDRPCYGVQEVLSRYTELVPQLRLAGPTNFAPLIHQAINIVREEKAYHILMIIADGQVTNEADTRAAIVEASRYPLSIVMVGVGDGPWDMMDEFDNGLEERLFDNWQFVNFTDVVQRAKNLDVDFAVAALMEIPEQFKAIRAHRLL